MCDPPGLNSEGRLSEASVGRMLLLGPSPSSPTDAATLDTTAGDSVYTLYTEQYTVTQNSVRALAIVDFVDLM